MQRLKIPGLALCAATLVACASAPYRIEVMQGNVVTKEQKEALKLGMPRAQVQDILGTPMVASAFHESRWDYVFSLRRQGQALQQRKLSVSFKGDELEKVEGDELPSEQEFVNSLSTLKLSGKAPRLQALPEELSRANRDAKPAVATAPTPAAQAPRSYPPLEAAQ